MATRQEISQFSCRACGKPTLHIRMRYEVPHLGHLLITLLTCGLWIFVWILHMLLNSFPSEPWRCSRCGQNPKDQTVGEQAAWTREKLQRSADRTAKWSRAFQHAGERALVGLLKVRAVLEAIGGFTIAAPGRIDMGLRTLAGKDNVILYRFFVLLVFAAVPFLLVLLLFGLMAI